MRHDPGKSKAGVSMQKVKPVITNVNSDLYRFLRTVIYEERGGPAWYLFSLVWLLSMVIITMVVISGMAAIGTTYISTIGEDHIAVILYKIFSNLITAFVIYMFIGSIFDCAVFPLYESRKDWL